MPAIASGGIKPQRIDSGYGVQSYLDRDGYYVVRTQFFYADDDVFFQPDGRLWALPRRAASRGTNVLNDILGSRLLDIKPGNHDKTAHSHLEPLLPVKSGLSESNFTPVFFSLCCLFHASRSW
jgi:hypothetical protein